MIDMGSVSCPTQPHNDVHRYYSPLLGACYGYRSIFNKLQGREGDQTGVIHTLLV